MNLNKLYRSVAEWLTRLENHQRLVENRAPIQPEPTRIRAIWPPEMLSPMLPGCRSIIGAH